MGFHAKKMRLKASSKNTWMVDVSAVGPFFLPGEKGQILDFCRQTKAEIVGSTRAIVDTELSILSQEW